MVLRMQRITNLDRDEALPTDLNALLSDVTDLLKSAAQASTAVELDLQPLPALSIRPLQMSAVFSNLLQNAIDASGATGTVKISTRRLLWVRGDRFPGRRPGYLVRRTNPCF